MSEKVKNRSFWALESCRGTRNKQWKTWTTATRDKSGIARTKNRNSLEAKALKCLEIPKAPYILDGRVCC